MAMQVSKYFRVGYCHLLQCPDLRKRTTEQSHRTETSRRIGIAMACGPSQSLFRNRAPSRICGCLRLSHLSSCSRQTVCRELRYVDILHSQRLVYVYIRVSRIAVLIASFF